MLIEDAKLEDYFQLLQHFPAHNNAKWRIIQ